jgi:hypothetical protein
MRRATYPELKSLVTQWTGIRPGRAAVTKPFSLLGLSYAEVLSLVLRVEHVAGIRFSQDELEGIVRGYTVGSLLHAARKRVLPNPQSGK